MKCVLFVFFFLIAISSSGTAQTDTTRIHKNPNQGLYKSGTVMISTDNPGKLYFDENFIFSIKKFNLAKIRGIKPGVHTIAMKTDVDSIRKEITVKKGWKYTGKIKGDTIMVKRRLATDPLLAKRAHTKLYSYVPKLRGFYNVTQFGLISMGMNADGYYPLNSISTICGYRFTPRFSMGVGAGFCFMKSGSIPVKYQVVGDFNSLLTKRYSGGTAGFFPLFLDLRYDWALKKVAPVFYLNVGLTLVYHQTFEQFEYNDSFVPNNPTVVDIEFPTNTGPYFISAGFGTKIYISNNIAIVPAIEFSYKQVIYDVYQYRNIYGLHNPTDHGTINFLTVGLVLGISF